LRFLLLSLLLLRLILSLVSIVGGLLYFILILKNDFVFVFLAFLNFRFDFFADVFI